MSVLRGLAVTHTVLSEPHIEHLHRLAADWQILADLAFSDLLLFAPMRTRDDACIILAQVRPSPTQTLYHEDMVGVVSTREDRPRLWMALEEGRIVREGEPEWREGVPVREEVIPVSADGRTIALVGAEQNLATARTPSQLELSYLQAAGDLAQMVAEGTFPFPDELGEQEISLRVGDGFMRLEIDWTIRYASPNAISAYRRIGAPGSIIGQPIQALGIDERTVLARLRRGEPVESEIEVKGAWMLRRFLPVVHRGAVTGALVLVRDITEVRRRDRMLLIKDATIREIHHRVKNNLQTVAALLRLQGRRIASEEGREALEESVRRITSIAVVHEMLSLDSHEWVDFDAVADRIVRMAEDSLTGPDRPIAFRLDGHSGDLPSDIATPLALALAELIQNAVEHGIPAGGGRVEVRLARERDRLRLVVADDGKGLPEDFTLEESSNLGLQIVRTLVTTELGGEIAVTDDDGTRIELSIPLARG